MNISTKYIFENPTRKFAKLYSPFIIIVIFLIQYHTVKVIRLVPIVPHEHGLELFSGSVSVREKHVCDVDTEKELENYKRDRSWMEDCNKNFSEWCNAVEKVPLPQRKVIVWLFYCSSMK